MTGQSETKHTRGELEVGGRNGYGAHNGVNIRYSRGLVAAVAIGDVPELDAEANAARIVLTWNCHDELVAALLDIIEYDGGAESALHDPYVMERAREALAKATSPTP